MGVKSLSCGGSSGCFWLPSLRIGGRDSSRQYETELTLTADDVIPTGNDWIALPSIRAGDAALMDFNVISMRYRGLIEFAGAPGNR